MTAKKLESIRTVRYRAKLSMKDQSGLSGIEFALVPLYNLTLIGTPYVISRNELTKGVQSATVRPVAWERAGLSPLRSGSISRPGNGAHRNAELNRVERIGWRKR